LAYLTPASVHYGKGDIILAKRNEVKRRAFIARPDRFSNRQPKPYELPEKVWINKPSGQELQLETPVPPGKVTLISHR